MVCLKPPISGHTRPPKTRYPLNFHLFTHLCLFDYIVGTSTIDGWLNPFDPSIFILHSLSHVKSCINPYFWWIKSNFVATGQMLSGLQRNRKELELLLTLFWAPATVFVVAEAMAQGMCRGWVVSTVLRVFLGSRKPQAWNFRKIPTIPVSIGVIFLVGAGNLDEFPVWKDRCPWALESFWSREARSWATSACTRASLPLVQKRVARVNVGQHMSWA